MCTLKVIMMQAFLKVMSGVPIFIRITVSLV
jgi:hypothetical protein